MSPESWKKTDLHDRWKVEFFCWRGHSQWGEWSAVLWHTTHCQCLTHFLTSRDLPLPPLSSMRQLHLLTVDIDATTDPVCSDKTAVTLWSNSNTLFDYFHLANRVRVVLFAQIADNLQTWDVIGWSDPSISLLGYHDRYITNKSFRFILMCSFPAE